MNNWIVLPRDVCRGRPLECVSLSFAMQAAQQVRPTARARVQPLCLEGALFTVRARRSRSRTSWKQ